jgi:uncharacterized protein YbaR (Trm112 family)
VLRQRQGNRLNCWACNTPLVWSGDHDAETDGGEYLIETSLTCPGCQAFVLVYHGRVDSDDDELYARACGTAGA